MKLLQFETAKDMRERIKPYERFAVFYSSPSFHTNEKHRAMLEENGTVFVFGKGKRRYGTRYKDEEFIKLFACEDIAEAWERRVKNVIKKLEASGLWKEVKEGYETLLKLGYDKRHDYRVPYLTWEAADACTKSMYFGYRNANVKERISECFRNMIDCEFRTDARYDGTNYDVTFSYNAEKNQAVYAEEYRGCGNGHYYIAIDGSTALFCEDD